MIFHIKRKERNFTQIDNACLNDKRLSFKAKGILAYLLSKPDGWRSRIEDISDHSADGIRAVASGMKELTKYGYAKLLKLKDEHGKWQGSAWEIYEEPHGESQNGSLRNQDTRKQCVSNSNTDQRNTDLSNTRKLVPADEGEEYRDALRMIEENLVGIEAARKPSWFRRADINPTGVRRCFQAVECARAEGVPILSVAAYANKVWRDEFEPAATNERR